MPLNLPIGYLSSLSRKANEILTLIENKTDPLELTAAYKSYKARMCVFYNACTKAERIIKTEEDQEKFNEWYDLKWAKITSDKGFIGEYMQSVLSQSELSINLYEIAEDDQFEENIYLHYLLCIFLLHLIKIMLVII